jgi:hypothetical protein
MNPIYISKKDPLFKLYYEIRKLENKEVIFEEGYELYAKRIFEQLNHYFIPMKSKIFDSIYNNKDVAYIPRIYHYTDWESVWEYYIPVGLNYENRIRWHRIFVKIENEMNQSKVENARKELVNKPWQIPGIVDGETIFIVSRQGFAKGGIKSNNSVVYVIVDKDPFRVAMRIIAMVTNVIWKRFLGFLRSIKMPYEFFVPKIQDFVNIKELKEYISLIYNKIKNIRERISYYSSNIIKTFESFKNAFKKFIDNLESLKETIEYRLSLKYFVDNLKRKEFKEISDYEVPKPNEILKVLIPIIRS